MARKNIKNKNIIEASSNMSNPYFTEKKGYVDLRANDKLDKATYKVITFISLFIAILAVCGCIYVGTKSKFIPMIYKENSQGGIMFVGYPDGPLRITSNMIGNQIAEYIIAARRIPQDMDLKTEDSKKVKSMTAQTLFSSYVQNMLISRYELYANKTLKITIRNILPTGKNTWQMDWDENSDGTFIGKYKASITFTLQNDLTDPAKLLNNPLGLVVTDLNISPYIRAD